MIWLLREEGPCLVVNKPGGLLTQSPPGIDSVEDQVKAYLRHREQLAADPYLGVPHRLDRPSSGAIVLTRSRRATRALARQFEARRVSKQYLVFVEGQLADDGGRWQDFLRKVPGTARVEIVDSAQEGARYAELEYRVLARTAAGSYLSVWMLTGRMHQIRVQAAARGHPVLGDASYGAQSSFGPERDDPRERWIALHAHSLSFLHPQTQQRVTVEAPCPRHWRQIIDQPPPEIKHEMRNSKS